MMKKKIIFLDHDGVICLKHNWGSQSKTLRDFDDFDTDCIKILNHILLVTDAEIVVTSDWRLLDLDLLTMQYHYKELGVHKQPIAFTPNLLANTFGTKNKAEMRTKEILKYCFDYKDEIDTWVAIDDLELSLPKLNFVKTNTELGLNQPNIMQEVIEKLT